MTDKQALKLALTALKTHKSDDATVVHIDVVYMFPYLDIQGLYIGWAVPTTFSDIRWSL